MLQEKRISGIKKVGLLLGVCAALLLVVMGQTSYALQLNAAPDLKAAGIVVQYTNNGQLNNFSALGYAEKYNGDDSLFGNNSYFDLYATISSTGVLGGGTLAIYDEIDLVDGYSSSADKLYLSGILTKLMFTSAGQPLEFLFTPTSDDFEAAYGSLGGIILSNSGFTSFGSSSFSTDSGSADVGTPVPEPSTVCLLLLGVGGLFFARRRKA